MFKDEDPISSRSPSVEEAGAESATEVGGRSETTRMSPPQSPAAPKKAVHKQYDEEKRAVGRIARNVWLTYFRACGSRMFWSIFALIFALASISPNFNNGWLRWI